MRVSDWTFPNSNHIFQPTLENDDAWMDVGIWIVPVDDERSARFNIYARPSVSPEQDRKFRDYFQTYAEGYPSADLHDQLFDRHKCPDDRFMQLTSAQDYVAQVGQGTIADRANEYLGQSDAGIVVLRKILWRELDLLRAGKPTKRWRKLDRPAELPKQAGAATVDA